MGTTPNLAIPYPETSDAPAAPMQMQALATALDTYFAPVTISVTGGTNINASVDYHFTCRKRGAGVVLAAELAVTGAIAANAIIGTVSATGGARPVGRPAPFVAFTSTGAVSGKVGLDGTIRLPDKALVNGDGIVFTVPWNI